MAADMDTIADKIRSAREAKGLSQADLAKKIGSSQQTVAKLEAGTITFSRFFPRISKILDIPLPSLDETYRVEVMGSATVRTMPVYSTFADESGATFMSKEPAFRMIAPSYLDDNLELFGCIVPNGKMGPTVLAGDILVCSNDEPNQSRLCVVRQKPQPGDSGRDKIQFGLFLGEGHGLYILFTKLRRYGPDHDDEPVSDMALLKQEEWQAPFKIHAVVCRD